MLHEMQLTGVNCPPDSVLTTKMTSMQDKKPRILCLDDQRENLRLRKMFLEQFGCEVIAVEDADACLRVATHEAIDLALLDYHLSGEITGEHVAQDLRALFPEMPLIMLTGDPNLPDSAKKSVDMFFIKGASSPADLLDAMENLLPDHSLKPRHKPVTVSAS